MAKKGEIGMELLGFTDVTGYAGIEPDSGEAIVKPLTVTVNEENHGLNAKYAQRIHGERIFVYKQKLPATVKGNEMNVVTKKWKEVQQPVGEAESGTISAPERSYKPMRTYEEPASSGKEEPNNEITPLGAVKNMVDKLSDRVDRQGMTHILLIGASLVIGGIALGLGLGLLK